MLPSPLALLICIGLCVSGDAGAHSDARASPNEAVPTALSSEDREHGIKAAFLLHFVRYTTWPRKSFEDEHSPIRILVVGKDPFGPLLEDTFRGEKAHGRPFEVARSASVPDEPAAHLVFCGELTGSERGALLERCRGKPILLIGEVEDFAVDGACINFYLQDKKTRFEINTDALAAASLELSPAVLKLAKIVRSRSSSDEKEAR